MIQRRIIVAVTLLLACCCLSAAAASDNGSSSEDIWTVGGSTGVQHHCCNVPKPSSAQPMQEHRRRYQTVCSSGGAALAPDTVRLVARCSADVLGPVRVLTDGCSKSDGLQCTDGIFNHSLDETCGRSAFEPDFEEAFPIAHIRIPTTLLRPGDTLRGLVFVREQLSPLVANFSLLPADALVLTLLDPSGEPVAAYDWTENVPEDDARLFQFALPVSQFLAAGPYRLRLTWAGTVLQTVPMTVGHHVKHAINVTVLTDDAWVVPGRLLTVNVSAAYFWNMPLYGVCHGRVEFGSVSEEFPIQSREHSLSLRLPPSGVLDAETVFVEIPFQDRNALVGEIISNVAGNKFDVNRFVRKHAKMAQGYISTAHPPKIFFMDATGAAFNMTASELGKGALPGVTFPMVMKVEVAKASPAIEMGAKQLKIDVIDALGRTGTSQTMLEVVPSPYGAKFGSLPSTVQSDTTLPIVVTSLHRSAPRDGEQAALTLGELRVSARKHVVRDGGYPAHCGASCASVGACATFDGNPQGCGNKTGCEYYDAKLVELAWCDPLTCVECWHEARREWSHNGSVPIQDGRGEAQLTLVGPGIYNIEAQAFAATTDGMIELGRDQWELKVTDGNGSTGQAISSGRAPLPEPPRVVFARPPSVEAGLLRGSVRLKAAPNSSGTHTVYIDAYGVGGRTLTEVLIDGETPADFALPVPQEAWAHQSLRVDAYLDPLPMAKPELVFVDEFDPWSFGGIYGEDVNRRIFDLPGLTSSEVHVRPQPCEATLSVASGEKELLMTGSTVDITLNVDPCFVNGSASLMLVDNGVASQDTYMDPPVRGGTKAPRQAQAMAATPRLRDDVCIATGISPRCVLSLPARLTVSGWGLASEDGPPKVTVGGVPCPVLGVRRVFVQKSTASSRGKWVRWVDCMANSTGDVRVAVHGKDFRCVGDCAFRTDARCAEQALAANMSELREQLCERWAGSWEYGSWYNALSTKPVVGISFGMTNAAVGIYKNGRVEIMPNEHGDRVTPAIVRFTDDQVVVGSAARTNASVNDTVVSEVKRFIGRLYSEINASRTQHLEYDIVDVNGSNNVGIPVRGLGTLKPEAIASHVLKYMKQTSENYLEREIERAVLTVPAHFNDRQRKAMKTAGELAGLDVLRIINEPTAAAVAYGLDKKSEQNILVYRLGGASLDVALLTIDNGVFEVLATSPEDHLGGNGFTDRLLQHVLKVCSHEYENRYPNSSRACQNKFRANITINPRIAARLRRAVDQTKRTLSSAHKACIEADLGGEEEMSLQVTRARFEEINRDLVHSTLEHVKRVLNESGITVDQVDEIVLAGGSTRIPFVRQRIKEFFRGKEPNRGINPDEVLAYGAAVQAGLLSGEGGQDLLLLDVTPLSLGVKLYKGTMEMVIQRNSVIPIKKTVQIAIAELAREAHLCKVPIFEGERLVADRNHALGVLQVPCTEGDRVDVTFDIDSNGILTVTAVDQASGSFASLTITNDNERLTEDQIEAMIRDAEAAAEEDAVAADSHGNVDEDCRRSKVERTDFRESIVFPVQRLDGPITLFNVTLPDAVTSWHVKAVVANVQNLHTAELPRPLAVANPIFSLTTVPPFLMLGDEITVPTTVENLLSVPLHNVSVVLRPGDGLSARCIMEAVNSRLPSEHGTVAEPSLASQCDGASPQLTITNIPPGQRGSVYWHLRATRVGDASLNTTVVVGTPRFQEDSSLQTPLRIGPAGTPEVSASHGIVSKESGLNFTVRIPEIATFAIAAVTVLPEEPAAIALDGLEALAAYPYGCCEQRSSKVNSNLVLLRHLDQVGDELGLREKLVFNVRAGIEALQRECVQSSGGSGMWPDSSVDAFHTAIVYSTLSEASRYVTVDPLLIDSMARFIADLQRPDGHFRPPHWWGESSGMTWTAYILHAQMLGNISNDRAFSFLWENRNKLDTAALALTSRAAYIRSLGDSQMRDGLARRLERSARCSSTSCFWPRGGSMSSSVETTAYAVSALALAGRFATECSSGDGGLLIDKAIHWLLQQRTTAGWQTTIDTLWATLALTDVAASKTGVFGNGSVRVLLDGELVRSIRVTKSSMHKAMAELRSLFLPLLPGERRIDVRWDGDAAVHGTVEVRSYGQRAAAGAGSWARVEQQVAAPNPRPAVLREGTGWSVPLRVSLSWNASDWRYEQAGRAMVLEIPIPSGTEVSDESFQSLSRHPSVQRAELYTTGERPLLGLFLAEAEVKEPTEFDVEFVGTGVADLMIGGVRLLPMYQPEHAVASNPERVTVAV